MNRENGACGVFAILVGAFLLIEGVWGLSSPVVFGVLATNLLHAVIHIALGAIGIWVGLKSGARKYCLFLGGLLVAVGALWFVPVVGPIITSLLNVNAAVAYLNLVVGAVALVLAFTARPEQPQSRT
ncbi:MAG: DUF4383 domain-containing protein [Vicinamibacterales bacterium]